MDENIAEEMILEMLTNKIDSYNSSSSSSSDSGSDKSSTKKKICVGNFIEDVVSNYNEEEFRQDFRLNRETAQIIIEQLNAITPKNPASWPQLSSEKMVLLTLWYLGNQETIQQISNRFDVSTSCALYTINKITKCLVDLAPEYIKWPDAHRMQEISRSFEKNGIKNVVGAIDVCSITIKNPVISEGYNYVNKNGYCSILLQGVVDCNMNFININVGEPSGSLYEATVLKKSSLYKRASNNTEIFQGNVLLGDSSYPSLQWLVPPFKDNLSSEQKQFNHLHSSTRIVIKHAFEILKGRFRRLQYFENNHVEMIINCVISACVLHNLCVLKDDDGDEFRVNIDASDDEETA